MAFRLKASDGTVGAAIRRIAGEQIDKALAALDSDDQAEAIHALRLRCKKLRGVIRLVRPVFPAYADTNAFYRDLAANLADLRDAKVMQDTCDALGRHYADRIDRSRIDHVRQAFAAEHAGLTSGSEIADRLAHCRVQLLQGRARVQQWHLEGEGFEAISGGFAKTYRRARKAADKAFHGGGPDNHHELRKRVKYHWMHARLLHPIAPREMKARAHLAKKLAALLGDHHDLAVLAERIGTLREHDADRRDVELVATLAAERLEHHSRKAETMAARLLAEKTGKLVDRVEALWTPWAKRKGFG